MPTRCKGWMVVLLLGGTMAYALAEELTLTTYYPSPRGVYQELRTQGDVAIGRLDAPSARLEIVGASDLTGNALQVRSANQSTLLLVQNNGNAAIGASTVPAGYKLYVAGMIGSTTGGYTFPDGTVQTTAAGGSFTFPSDGSVACVAAAGAPGTRAAFPSCPAISLGTWTTITLSSSVVGSNAKVAIISSRCYGGSPSPAHTYVFFRPVGSTLNDTSWSGLMNQGCQANAELWGGGSDFDTNTTLVPLNSNKQFQVYISAPSNGTGIVSVVGYY